MLVLPVGKYQDKVESLEFSLNSTQLVVSLRNTDFLRVWDVSVVTYLRCTSEAVWRRTTSVNPAGCGPRGRIMDDLGPFCCQNSDCPDVGKRGHGNLTVTSRYGAGKARRMLRCSTCKARFSERKGTPLFKARLTPTTAVAVLAHVAEGVGTRKTARLTGVHPDTVTRYARLAGDHAAELHDELVAFSPGDQ